MNATRHANHISNDRHSRGVNQTLIWLPIVLLLIGLVFGSAVRSIHPGAMDRNGKPQSAPTSGFDADAIINPTGSGSILTAFPVTGTRDGIAAGIFLLPAETETPDNEPILIRNLGPSPFAVVHMALTPRYLAAARRGSTPLYLYHQSLLC